MCGMRLGLATCRRSLRSTLRYVMLGIRHVLIVFSLQAGRYMHSVKVATLFVTACLASAGFHALHIFIVDLVLRMLRRTGRNPYYHHVHVCRAFTADAIFVLAFKTVRGGRNISPHLTSTYPFILQARVLTIRLSWHNVGSPCVAGVWRLDRL